MLPEYNLAPHLEQTHGSDVQRDATGLDDYAVSYTHLRAHET